MIRRIGGVKSFVSGTIRRGLRFCFYSFHGRRWSSEFRVPGTVYVRVPGPSSGDSIRNSIPSLLYNTYQDTGFVNTGS